MEEKTMTYPWLASIILTCSSTFIFYLRIRYLNTYPLKSKLPRKIWLGVKKYYEWKL